MIPARYRKFAVALVGAAVAGLSLGLGAHSLVVQEIVAVATALGVYAVPNG